MVDIVDMCGSVVAGEAKAVIIGMVDKDGAISLYMNVADAPLAYGIGLLSFMESALAVQRARIDGAIEASVVGDDDEEDD